MASGKSSPGKFCAITKTPPLAPPIAPNSLSTLAPYELAPGTDLVITAENGKLFRQRGTAAKAGLVPEAADIFFRPGVEGRTLFHSDAHGRVDALVDRRNNEDIVWKKIK